MCTDVIHKVRYSGPDRLLHQNPSIRTEIIAVLEDKIAVIYKCPSLADSFLYN